ncbi:hypothetical protein OG689_41300 [Kitasatospora sp. NBC_00240]|uniref:hypothetical protein n=1 Tax=Kitasatospora sp. NBC_00240 TaxID=2903567 RepID=UPI00225C0631|nr:hypothetical protein [Kitasatospora sp. NBC_00240]MCX5215593.1 hypothetical protein [Kitasatospora sp. NBC_00240]
MTPVQSVLQFLVEADTDPAGPQADQLANAASNIASVFGVPAVVANTVGAVRKLRRREDREQPAVLCCRGACPVPPEAGAE